MTYMNVYGFSVYVYGLNLYTYGLGLNIYGLNLNVCEVTSYKYGLSSYIVYKHL